MIAALTTREPGTTVNPHPAHVSLESIYNHSHSRFSFQFHLGTSLATTRPCTDLPLLSISPLPRRDSACADPAASADRQLGTPSCSPVGPCARTTAHETRCSPQPSLPQPFPSHARSTPSHARSMRSQAQLAHATAASICDATHATGHRSQFYLARDCSAGRRGCHPCYATYKQLIAHLGAIAWAKASSRSDRSWSRNLRQPLQ